MPVLALEPGWTVPRQRRRRDACSMKSIRVAIGEGRELVDPDAPRYGGKGIVEEPIVDPSAALHRAAGALRCGCIRNTTCVDDGRLLRLLWQRDGRVRLSASAIVTVPANCTSLGTDGCPCYRLGCRSGLTCDRSGARGTINFCFDGRPKVVPAPPNPETGYSCLEADPSPWHVVPGPADWFVVIITIIVLAMSFARWSMKLLTRNLLASSSDDDQIKLMTEQGVLSTQMHFEAFGGNGDGGANGAAGRRARQRASTTARRWRSTSASSTGRCRPRRTRTRSTTTASCPTRRRSPTCRRCKTARCSACAHRPRAARGARAARAPPLAAVERVPTAHVHADRRVGKRSVRSVVAFLWHGRIPGSQARLRDAILAALFVLLHVLFFVGFQDPCLAAQIAGDEWRLRARAVASTFGYIASADGLLLVVPATRNSVLTILLGLEFDETILFHRWLGRWTLLMLLLHGLTYFPIWFDDWESFVQYRVPLPKFAYALVSGIGSLLLAIFSLEYFRRNYFQVFYWSHYLFLAFYIAGGLHSPKVFARLAIAAMILYVVDRLVRFITGVWPRRCIENTALGGNCTRVVFPEEPAGALRRRQLRFPQLPADLAHRVAPVHAVVGPARRQQRVPHQGARRLHQQGLRHDDQGDDAAHQALGARRRPVRQVLAQPRALSGGRADWRRRRHHAADRGAQVDLSHLHVERGARRQSAPHNGQARLLCLVVARPGALLVVRRLLSAVRAATARRHDVSGAASLRAPDALQGGAARLARLRVARPTGIASADEHYLWRAQGTSSREHRARCLPADRPRW
jgi:hypothetical protein